MNVAVGLMDGLGLDGDRCISVIPRHPSRCVLELNICNGKNKAGLIRILLICSYSVLQPIKTGFNSIRPLIDQATVLAENTPLTLSARKSLWADRSRTMPFSCNFTHPQNFMGNCSSTIRTCFDKLITFETQRLENGLICWNKEVFLLPPANEVLGKVIFHKRVSFLLSTERGRGGSASRGVCIRGCGQTPPMGYYRIRPTSGRYASYWKAFSSIYRCDFYFLETHCISVQK